MALAETLSAPPDLVGCQPPPEKMAPFWTQILFAGPNNQYEALPREAYEKPVWTMGGPLFGRFYVINDPAGIKRVLLDNVANYPKTEMEAKLLGGILGEGLLVSQGDKWKSHRRMMAPSFDFKSLVSYAPAMVEQAELTARNWTARNSDREVDIAEE